MYGRTAAFAIIAVAGCAVDLATKEWIFGLLGMPGTHEPIWIWPDVFCLTTSLNEGALFGMGQGWGRLFSLLSVVASVGILYWLFWGRAITSKWLTTALGMVLGGILGNLYDRLGWPGLTWNYPAWRIGDPVFAVRDWLYFSLIEFPVFNVADSLLVCGVTMIVLAGAFPQVFTSAPRVVPAAAEATSRSA